MKKITLFLSAMLFSVMSFAGVITFTPGEFEALESSKFDVVKDGVTLSCSSGTITADQFRFFKSQTLTVSSTAGNITSIEFTCTALNDTKYGPGSFGELEGYSYADKVGTWIGSAASVTFSTTNNQVRATQVVVTIDGEGGGETPDTPDTPDTPEEPENPETPVGSIDGYSKVTNAASLVDGDKVVLYCNDSQVGITGWDGTKTATAAATGWVEYVVEVADGGFFLKDGEQYIALTVKNSFSYNATGSVCKVTADGVLYITLAADGKDYLLYENANNGNPLYRMYVDKTGNSQYKPFYVYKAGEGGGDNPGGNDDPVTPEVSTTITGLKEADAVFVADAEYGDYWAFDLFAGVDEEMLDYVYPELYVMVNESYGKTTINGTYNVLYSEYFPTADSEGIYTDEEAEDFVGTLTIKNVDNNGNYSFKGSFTATDGKTYTYDQVVKVTAYEFMGEDEEGYGIYEDLTLSESGDTPDNPDTPVTPAGMITCAEAATIAAAENYKGTENVTVYGYVVELGSQKVDDKTGRNKQTFWLSDVNGGEKQFQAYWAFVPDYFEVGDKVAITGILQNYKGTIEISDGEAVLLNETGVEDVLVENTPVKVLKNGQMYIMQGNKVYTIMGTQVK